ncbi:hypothetical protein BaRGS_00021801 [Batillaria attramentaria]|uniref:Uncharacterized protein n=1 Tax=Batillaria attramentaria TaxID=370345 RepID=A0ABD0KJN6_9CAEN
MRSQSPMPDKVQIPRPDISSNSVAMFCVLVEKTVTYHYPSTRFFFVVLNLKTSPQTFGSQTCWRVESCLHALDVTNVLAVGELEHKSPKSVASTYSHIEAQTPRRAPNNRSVLFVKSWLLVKTSIKVLEKYVYHQHGLTSKTRPEIPYTGV